MTAETSYAAEALELGMSDGLVAAAWALDETQARLLDATRVLVRCEGVLEAEPHDHLLNQFDWHRFVVERAYVVARLRDARARGTR